MDEFDRHFGVRPGDLGENPACRSCMVERSPGSTSQVDSQAERCCSISRADESCPPAGPSRVIAGNNQGTGADRRRSMSGPLMSGSACPPSNAGNIQMPARSLPASAADSMISEGLVSSVGKRILSAQQCPIYPIPTEPFTGFANSYRPAPAQAIIDIQYIIRETCRMKVEEIR
jgi:hypothetical protein